jgi:hypothetical protein
MTRYSLRRFAYEWVEDRVLGLEVIGRCATGRDWLAPRRVRYPVCKGSTALSVSPAPLPQTVESETAGLNTRSIVWPSRFVSS